MPIPFTVRQLEYFIAVAEHGSVLAAASACRVSQPSISVAIADLEASLNRKLFRREAGRKLTITPGGRRLLMQARTILSTATKMTARDAGIVPPSEIALATFRDLGAMYLPRMMKAFGVRHPEVGFRLSELDLEMVKSSLLDGRCELALTYDIGLKTTGIVSKPIDRLAPYVMLSATHPLGQAETVGFNDLTGQRLILESFPVTIDYFLDMFRRRRVATDNIQFVPSFEMQRGLVANGWGVGLSCVRPRPDISYDGTGFVCVPLKSDEPEQDVVLAHLGEETLSAASLAFLSSAGDR